MGLVRDCVRSWGTELRVSLTSLLLKLVSHHFFTSVAARQNLSDLLAIALDIRPSQIGAICFFAPFLLKTGAQVVSSRSVFQHCRLVSGELARSGGDQQGAPFRVLLSGPCEYSLGLQCSLQSALRVVALEQNLGERQQGARDRLWCVHLPGDRNSL